MKLVKFVVVCLLALMVCAPMVQAQDQARVTKFQACENASGSGIYWVDTTTGRTWWANPATMKWEFIGRPKNAALSSMGTYLPYKNKSGEGLFIMNTSTGQAWWTNRVAWKSLGKPEEKDPTAKQ